MRNEGWRACFFLHSSLKLISKGYAWQQAQLLFEMPVDWQKYEWNMDSCISPSYSVSLEVSEEFLKDTQSPPAPQLFVQVPPGEWRGVQISPKQKFPKYLVLV